MKIMDYFTITFINRYFVTFNYLENESQLL